MSTWQIDPAHTEVSFVAKHMMVTKVRGEFGGVTGTISFDEANPAASSVEVTILVASVDSGVEMRDNHIRSADFLDAEHYPSMTFRSTSIAPKGDRWTLTGDLTIRGVTHSIAIDAEHLGIVPGMRGPGRHVGFEGHVKIKRSDWGLTWNVGLEAGGWLVSDDLQIDLEVAADEVVAAASADELAGATA